MLLGVLPLSANAVKPANQQGQKRSCNRTKRAEAPKAVKDQGPVGQSKEDPKKKDGDPAVEEALIDRLIGLLKDQNQKAAEDKGKWREQDKVGLSACIALAKRGNKAKRAAPEMIKYLENRLPKKQNRGVGVYEEAEVEQILRA